MNITENELLYFETSLLLKLFIRFDISLITVTWKLIQAPQQGLRHAVAQGAHRLRRLGRTDAARGQRRFGHHLMRPRSPAAATSARTGRGIAGESAGQFEYVGARLERRLVDMEGSLAAERAKLEHERTAGEPQVAHAQVLGLDPQQCWGAPPKNARAPPTPHPGGSRGNAPIPRDPPKT